MNQNLFVTVFVPVYNGEKYLVETLKSIQNQTYTYFEVLLVDDTSTDGSKNILDEFAKADQRFKVFSKQNGGTVAASWNFIMPEIKGEYVFYSSQDDIFSEDLLEKLVQKQQETNADSIMPDMELYYENEQKNPKTIGFNGNRDVVLSGREACAASLNWTIHGFPLTRTNLIVEEYFFEDAFDTDELITRKLFLKSNKVVFCESVFYYRQDNPNAITKTFSKKNFYVLNTWVRILDLYQTNNFEPHLIYYIQYTMLSRYFQLMLQHTKYPFETDFEKEKVANFLSDFKDNQLAYQFFWFNFKYILSSFKIKFMVLLMICRFRFLMDLVRLIK